MSEANSGEGLCDAAEQIYLEIQNDVINRITFRDWFFHVGRLGDGRYLQIQFTAPCSETGEDKVQHGRKWYISPHATPEEVVKTCWLAVEVALRHEAMEDFKIDGKAPFHPHADPFETMGCRRITRPNPT